MNREELGAELSQCELDDLALCFQLLSNVVSADKFNVAFHPGPQSKRQTPSTGLRHPSFNEGAGKRCSECESKTIRAIRDGEPRTATSTFTQLLSSEIVFEDPRTLKHKLQGSQAALLWRVSAWSANWFQRQAVSEEILAGTEIPSGGERGRLYLTLHCHQPE